MNTHPSLLSLHQRGVTLIEVLVAIVVLSIGVLGVATLQFTSLQNGQQSYQRSQASLLAYEAVDLMRANRTQAIADALAIDPAAPPTTAPSPLCNAADCTSAQLAAFDRYTWYAKVTSTLPAGTARISCSTSPCTVGSMQTVQVMWDEDRKGVTNYSCPPRASFNPDLHLACFTISFAP